MGNENSKQIEKQSEQIKQQSNEISYLKKK